MPDFIIKDARKASHTGAILSLAGSIFLQLRGFEVIRRHIGITNTFLILSVISFLGGIVAATSSLLIGKPANLPLKEKLCAWMGAILGLLGLAYILLGNYFLIKLRHM